ncbi:hypothetical protein Ait01nite_047350 [Actinoplanes italicus]|nr:hypothetical protein Ait01nite_047350 [Actinoplanes italicus]
MAEQLVTDRGPAAAPHGRTTGGAERVPPVGVVSEPGDRVGEPVGAVRGHQIAGTAVFHQVERPTGGRGDDREPAGHRLLHGLTERLVRPGVGEDVEARVDPAELSAVPGAEEDRVRQRPAQRRRGRAVADHHEPNPGQPGDAGQQVDLLLGGEPSDEPGQHLAVRGERPPDAGAAPSGVEADVVDSAPPQVHPAHAVRLERGDRLGGRGQSPAGRVVDGPDPAPRHPLGEPDPVHAGVRGHVGLIDGDRRQPERAGAGLRPGPEDERAGQVQDVGREPADRGVQGGRGQAEAQLRITGHRQRRDAYHRVRQPGHRRAGAGWWQRCHDHRLVAVSGQVVGHPGDRVRDAVDIGEERFGDERDAHVNRGTGATIRQETGP